VLLRAFHPSGLAVSETLQQITVTNFLDAALRATGMEWRRATDGSGLGGEQITYDGASRILGVTAGSISISFSYVPQSSALAALWFRYQGRLMMAQSRSYDGFGALGWIGSAPANAPPLSFTYARNE